jgi:hypothetical protein
VISDHEFARASPEVHMATARVVASSSTRTPVVQAASPASEAKMKVAPIRSSTLR